MYFSYNGTRDWLKIEWRDQSCMNLKLKNNSSQKIKTAKYAFDLKRDCIGEFSLPQIQFLLFLRDSPAYDKPRFNKSNLPAEDLSKYKQ